MFYLTELFLFIVSLFGRYIACINVLKKSLLLCCVLVVKGRDHRGFKKVYIILYTAYHSTFLVK